MVPENNQQVRGLPGMPNGSGPWAGGWPSMVGSMAWKGTDLQNEEQFIHHVSQESIQEVEWAVSDFKDLNLDVPDVDRDNFVLPTFGKKLLSGCRDVHSGPGFFVLRGFNPKKYSAEDNLLMFLGVSAYIGDVRAKQDSRGNMVVHLHHDSVRYPKPGVGPTRHTNKFSPFHTDNYCDIVALHVRDVAAEGGALKLASAWNVYNELAASRPDLVEALASPNWTFDARGVMFPEIERPLLFFHNGRILMDFSRSPLTGAQRDPDGIVSRLSQVQLEALKEVEKIAHRDQLVIDIQPGDMVFVNNHALIHSREAFRNDAYHTRHVARLWLKNRELAWKLPPVLDMANKRLFYANEIRERWAVTIGSLVQRGGEGGNGNGGEKSGSH